MLYNEIKLLSNIGFAGTWDSNSQIKDFSEKTGKILLIIKENKYFDMLKIFVIIYDGYY